VADAALPTWLYPDPGRSLAMIAVTGNSRPVENAFRQAYDVVMPPLDEPSFVCDQPLHIAHSLLVGIPSGIITMEYLQTTDLAIVEPAVPVAFFCPYPELIEATALYREGISDSNPFHQFLALWKAYENAVAIRGKWRRQHRREDAKPTEERFPDVLAFQPHVGKPFEKVRQELRPSYRHAISHADGTQTRPKTGATACDFVDVSCQIAALRYMARVVLENVRATLATTPPLDANRQEPPQPGQ